jgi:hypothetical protein
VILRNGDTAVRAKLKNFSSSGIGVSLTDGLPASLAVAGTKFELEGFEGPRPCSVRLAYQRGSALGLEIIGIHHVSVEGGDRAVV